MVPLPVVDARHATPAVVEELRWLLQPRLRGWVIFVSTDFETLPAVDAVDNSLGRADLHITMEQELPHAIGDWLQTYPGSGGSARANQARRPNHSLLRAASLGALGGSAVASG
jgi:hypothetical protein